MFSHQVEIVAELGAARHRLFIWRTTNTEHQLASLCLLSRSEKDLASDKLCKNASHGPDIDAKVVVSEADQELGSPIPESYHASSVHLVMVRGVNHSGQAEVSNLNFTLARKKNVSAFDVPVC